MHVMVNRARFREIFNSSLTDYRQVYKIRSHSHPFPELTELDQWTETPFWVWQTDNPFRRRLFVKQNGPLLTLSDLEDWHIEMEIQGGHEVLCKLSDQGIKIRPRALMTTMYCRLLISDLFVHGIGGAKYDQLTDQIAARFFGVELPSYCTISATLQLPTGIWPVTPADLVEARQRLRAFQFHAERFVDTAEYPDALSLIAAKSELVRQSTLPRQAKARRNAIEDLNRQLRNYVESQRIELEQQIIEISSKLKANRILDSREYSFCLFPAGIVDMLREMAAVPEQI